MTTKEPNKVKWYPLVTLLVTTKGPIKVKWYPRVALLVTTTITIKIKWYPLVALLVTTTVQTKVKWYPQLSRLYQFIMIEGNQNIIGTFAEFGSDFMSARRLNHPEVGQYKKLNYWLWHIKCYGVHINRKRWMRNSGVLLAMPSINLHR